MPGSANTVSILTPPGRGAVATVAVIGKNAAEHVSKRFRAASGKPLSEFPIGRIVFGLWQSEDDAGEQVVVCRRSPERVEIHCHGGRAATNAIVTALVNLGYHEEPWQSISSHEGRDGIAIQARIALAATRTERTTGILMDQYRGCLSEALRSVVDMIDDNQTTQARERLASIRRYSDVGLHLTDHYRVVVAGPANVGKSALINAVLGYERAIVYDKPGTTRDIVSATTAIDGWPVELLDTAGLRETTHDVELAGIRLAQGQLKSADLTLLVFDLSQPWTERDQELAGLHADALLVHNKCDLPASPVGSRLPGVLTSALTGEGIAELVDRIAVALVPEPPPIGAAVPFTTEQMAGLESVDRLLENDRCDQAIRKLVALQS